MTGLRKRGLLDTVSTVMRRPFCAYFSSDEDRSVREVSNFCRADCAFRGTGVRAVLPGTFFG